MTVISKHKASNFDLSEKQSALDMLVESLGAEPLQEKPPTRARRRKPKIDLSGKESIAVEAAIALGLISKEQRWTEKIEQLKRDEKARLKSKVSRKKYMQSIPWRHDFKNNCIKCNSAYHLQEHHVTYNPEIKTYLCYSCHKKVTKLNKRGSLLANGSLNARPEYTNRLRVTLWRWFLKTKTKLTEANVKRFLKTTEFKDYCV